MINLAGRDRLLVSAGFSYLRSGDAKKAGISTRPSSIFAGQIPILGIALDISALGRFSGPG